MLKGTELANLTQGRRATAVRAPATKRVRTVLCVEDSPIIRALVVEALNSHGLRVIEASDGKEALSQLEAHPEVELVVTDIEMPRLDGIGLIAAIRASGNKRLPTVVVSNRGSDEDKKRALTAGADAYLVKSEFSQAGLWSIISRFLGDHS